MTLVVRWVVVCGVFMLFLQGSQALSATSLLIRDSVEFLALHSDSIWVAEVKSVNSGTYAWAPVRVELKPRRSLKGGVPANELVCAIPYLDGCQEPTSGDSILVIRSSENLSQHFIMNQDTSRMIRCPAVASDGQWLNTVAEAESVMGPWFGRVGAEVPGSFCVSLTNYDVLPDKEPFMVDPYNGTLLMGRVPAHEGYRAIALQYAESNAISEQKWAAEALRWYPGAETEAALRRLLINGSSPSEARSLSVDPVVAVAVSSMAWDSLHQLGIEAPKPNGYLERDNRGGSACFPGPLRVARER